MWLELSNYYRRKAFKYKKKCSNCKTKEKLTVHHIDGNRKNNNLTNLKVLCVKCHNKEHKIIIKKKRNYSKYKKGTPKSKKK